MATGTSYFRKPSAYVEMDGVYEVRQQTPLEALQEVDEYLRAVYPADVKGRENVFRVSHSREDGLTYVELAAYSTRGEDGKKRATRYRYCFRAGVPVETLPAVPEHPPGPYIPCTSLWRFHHGFGAKVDDLLQLPDYVPAWGSRLNQALPGNWTDTELEVAAAEVARIAKIDSKTGSKPMKRDHPAHR